MWIFTEIGFFSAVCMEDDLSVVMVRGRVKKDMERLIDAINQLGLDAPEILEWEHRDYPYRILLLQNEWADVLAFLSKRVAYTNFKNRVKEVDGAGRASLYGRIWGVMLGAAQSIGERGTNRSLYEPGGYLFDEADLANEDTTPYAVLEEINSPPPPPPAAVIKGKRKKWFGKG
jgi:hypothetical protein